jgi:hypothetical protein
VRPGRIAGDLEDGEVIEASNSKRQAPGKFQTSNPKSLSINALFGLEFEVWSFSGFWMLEL